MRFFYGPVINPETLNSYAILPRALLAIGPDGRIAWLNTDCAGEGVLAHISARSPKSIVNGQCRNLVILNEGEFLIPGFVDTHTVCLLRGILCLASSPKHVAARTSST